MNTQWKSSWPHAFATVGLCALFAVAAMGCKSNSQAPIVNGTTADASPDAANGNMAPVDPSVNYATNSSAAQPTRVLGQNQSYTPQQQVENYGQQAPAPIERGYDNGDDSYNNTPDPYAGSDPGVIEYADQAPPPLPEYDQPPAPEPNYIWTPGYWAYGDGGYYWVPGVWCPPPYYGALWTPPYWGYYGGHYRYHHGYWGLHVGYYGGIDYGFGYIGFGYFGGYWRDHDFYYNRAVTRVNFNTNVYERPVVYNNRTYGPRIENRVSYNGGRGGINYSPRPAELAAMRETHVAAIPAQRQTRQAAMGNREQFFNANHGRPAQAAFVRPVGVTGPAHIADAPRAVQMEQQRSQQIQQRQTAQQPRPGGTEQPRSGAGPVPQRTGDQGSFQRSGGANAQPQRGSETNQPQRGNVNQPAQPQRSPEAVTRPQQQQGPTLTSRPASGPQRSMAQPQREQPQSTQPQRTVEQRPQSTSQPQRTFQPQAQPQPRSQPTPQPQRTVEQSRPQSQAAPQRSAPAAAPAPRAAAPAAAARPAPAAHPAPAAAPATHEEHPH